MTNANWMTPKKFFAGKKMALTVGQVIDPTQLGMPAHPVHGPLPTLTVTQVKEDGELLAGTISCVGQGGDHKCSETVTVHAGDWFQVRRCRTCQKRVSRRNSRSRLSPEEKAAREAERTQAKAERDAKKAAEKAAKAEERLKAEKERLAAKAAKAEQEAQAKIAALEAQAKTPAKAANA